MTINIQKPTCESRARSLFLDTKQTEFTEQDAVAMADAMTCWLVGQQVQDKKSQYYGAVWYPTERRYDNRDTACLLLACWRRFQETGEEKYRRQAELARDYVLAVQQEHGGYSELTFDNKPMDEGSTVNTGMIAVSLVRAFEAGLEWSERDLEALSRMADFLLTLEWTEGGFYHDMNHLAKNSRMDCQNTTALAAASLCFIHRFLSAQNYPVKAAWKEATQRAIERLLVGQDASGQWAYRIGPIEENPCDMNHHGMLMLYVGELYREFKDERLLQALVKGGLWLVEDATLPTPHGTKHNWTFQRSACLYFTAGYFFTSSALSQLAALDAPHSGYWKLQSLELLRYVRTDLWNNPNSAAEGPFHLTEAGMAPGYAWHGQAMGWCVYLMDHLLCDLNLKNWKLP